MIIEDKNELDVKTQREILQRVYETLKETGYNPIGQIVGYLLSEDPTYITDGKHARALIQKVDRDALMADIVRTYLGIGDES